MNKITSFFAVIFLAMILTAVSGCSNSLVEVPNFDQTELQEMYESVVPATITNFNDRIVSTNQTVLGTSIFSRNVTVQSNATLTFDARSMVTIDAPFTVNNNSQLVIWVR